MFKVGDKAKNIVAFCRKTSQRQVLIILENDLNFRDDARVSKVDSLHSILTCVQSCVFSRSACSLNFLVSSLCMRFTRILIDSHGRRFSLIRTIAQIEGREQVGALPDTTSPEDYFMEFSLLLVFWHAGNRSCA